jgi:serine acetyltransferase
VDILSDENICMSTCHASFFCKRTYLACQCFKQHGQYISAFSLDKFISFFFSFCLRMEFMNFGTGLMIGHGMIFQENVNLSCCNYLYSHCYMHLGILLGVLLVVLSILV